MSFVALLFNIGGQRASIGSVELDALTSEGLSLKSNVTSYAVEDGPPVNDHITQESEEVSISGVVTGASTHFLGAGGKSRLVDVRDALRQIHAERLPITITTGIDVYSNFAMSSCEVKRDNETGFLTVDCTLVKIRKATVKEADIPPEKVQAEPSAKNAKDAKGKGAKGKAGQTKANGGKAQVKDVSASDKKFSGAARKTSELSSAIGYGR